MDSRELQRVQEVEIVSHPSADGQRRLQRVYSMILDAAAKAKGRAKDGTDRTLNDQNTEIEDKDIPIPVDQG